MPSARPLAILPILPGQYCHRLALRAPTRALLCLATSTCTLARATKTSSRWGRAHARRTTPALRAKSDRARMLRSSTRPPPSRHARTRPESKSTWSLARWGVKARAGGNTAKQYRQYCRQVARRHPTSQARATTLETPTRETLTLETPTLSATALERASPARAIRV